MKKILGLDLGTTSIGWAIIDEAENEKEKSSIIKAGVRVVPLSSDEIKDFEKGKSITTNQERTLKRGARRSLQRYKLRREALIDVLKKNNILSSETVLSEQGEGSTFSLWKLRSDAAVKEISLEDFGKVLLAINKKRGYKSNRKANSDAEEGEAVDGMAIAMELINKNITPGEYSLKLLEKGVKKLPEFYRSDLENEFNEIWNKQKQFYPVILSDELKEQLKEKNKNQTWAILQNPFNLVGIKREDKGFALKVANYQLRVNGLSEKLDPENLAIVFQEINNQIKQSSGYLGKISDRSKELYFNKLTVGQYLFEQVKANPHNKLKNQVFYRQDYLDEFNQIWDIQSKYNKQVLTDDLKKEICNVIIFYQRKLKSQKGLISTCEYEGREIKVIEDGKEKTKTVGPKVIAKSNPLFQEFKIWQVLNNLKFENKETKQINCIQDLDKDLEIRSLMFTELNIKGKLSAKEVVKLVVKDAKKWEVKNFEELEGNRTNASLYNAFQNILLIEGYDFNFSKMTSDKVTSTVEPIFDSLGIDTKLLNFDSLIDGKDFELQPAYQFWHLLYSYEGDDSPSGNETLYRLLEEKFGFKIELAKELGKITFQDDYGSLSAKAIRKILPFLQAGHEFSEAASLAKYNHSNSVTKLENDNRILVDKLNVLAKNSLRNPVVEKILNQLVNVVNAIIDEHGRPDEIRVELARELKKNAKERASATTNISKSTKNHDNIIQILKKDFPPFNQGVRVTKNDIVKYKLWLETDKISLYTGKPIKGSSLFSKEYDIEHIIPKAVLFDDSFSNKTLCERELNREKSSATAYDFLEQKLNEKDFEQYKERVLTLEKQGKIGKGKSKKLLMKFKDIPDGFIERDLRNTQYISKKAQELLLTVVKEVTPTTGIITDKLRDDWQLVNVLKELNWEKYESLGLVNYEVNKDGKKISKITGWTKRNDHRHHAMDAITVAFTKRSHVQYFNYLNARRDEKHKKHSTIFAIENKETLVTDRGKRIVKPPIPIEDFRKEARFHLENVLVSFKAKNKVVTKNKNRIKIKNGGLTQEALTPRGQLHKETVYGISKSYLSKTEKVSAKFDKAMIALVAKKSHREALLNRLKEFDNDPKVAFSGKNALSKKPIFLDKENKIELPEKVKIVSFKDDFTIRKDISPELKIEKVVDIGVKRILEKRLEEFKGDSKKAFSNLDENPIFLNKEKTIPIKRVKISGVSNAEPLHYKKDKKGLVILDEKGLKIPTDYVSTGNNHHIAIFKDAEGNLQEQVVSFFEAVARVNQGVPIIQKNLVDHPDWEFQFSLKQNEYVIFPNEKTGFDPSEIDLLDESNTAKISPNLFRIQKITSKDYFFRHHLETTVEDNKDLKSVTWKRLSLSGISNLKKVRINHLGKIVSVGEY